MKSGRGHVAIDADKWCARQPVSEPTIAEADEAGSTKEFRYRVSICIREARETKHWLRMIAVASQPARMTHALGEAERI